MFCGFIFFKATSLALSQNSSTKPKICQNQYQNLQNHIKTYAKTHKTISKPTKPYQDQLPKLAKPYQNQNQNQNLKTSIGFGAYLTISTNF
jgi:hypothetical protein